MPSATQCSIGGPATPRGTRGAVGRAAVQGRAELPSAFCTTRVLCTIGASAGRLWSALTVPRKVSENSHAVRPSGSGPTRCGRRRSSARPGCCSGSACSWCRRPWTRSAAGRERLRRLGSDRPAAGAGRGARGCVTRGCGASSRSPPPTTLGFAIGNCRQRRRVRHVSAADRALPPDLGGFAYWRIDGLPDALAVALIGVGMLAVAVAAGRALARHRRAAGCWRRRATSTCRCALPS